MRVINPNSRDWLTVKEQCNEWVEADKVRLINTKTWDEAVRLQGRIGALMSVMNMEINPGALQNMSPKQE